MARLQYGALPYRMDEGGQLEILLVTSRRSRRWIIPKGWPIKGLKPALSAAREAFEEAGVVGRVDEQDVGRFSYLKLLEKTQRSIECEVIVFPLLVERQLQSWPEAAQRECRWVSTDEAVAMASDAGLKAVIHCADHRYIFEGGRYRVAAKYTTPRTPG